MDLYTKFVSTALFPLHERIIRPALPDRFRELEKSQWADRADIEKFRNSRLQDFMVGIARDVVFYSDLFRNIGVDPRNIQRPTDLAMLPLLDKATVRANVEKLKSRSANGLARYNTGGSSGEPLVFLLGKLAEVMTLLRNGAQLGGGGGYRRPRGRCLGFSNRVVRPGQSQKSQGRVIA